MAYRHITFWWKQHSLSSTSYHFLHL